MTREWYIFFEREIYFFSPKLNAEYFDKPTFLYTVELLGGELQAK